MKHICFAVLFILALITAAPAAAIELAPIEPIPVNPLNPPPPPPSNGCTVDDGGIPLPDADCDGIADENDNCIDTLNCDQADWDGNGTGDACQDLDHDGIPDAEYVQDETVNTAAVCDTETVVLGYDNCPMLYNPLQEDVDDDGIGDLCDDDDDDGIIDINDNCPDHANTRQLDRDNDTIGDSCDNCPLVHNPDQTDADDDGVGDVCGPDADNDGVPDSVDNCVFERNADQEDYDNDTVGDVCDNCPDDPNENQLDSDDNGIGDVCEPDTGFSTGGGGDEGMPAPAENPTFDVGETISGSGSFTSNNCQLSPLASASLEGIMGVMLIAAGIAPLIARRRRRT